MSKTSNSKHYVLKFQRVIEELSALLGFPDPGLIIQGGKLRIGEHLASFVHDEAASPNGAFVYLDLGPAQGDQQEATWKTLLKLNFELLAGTRGVVCMHPDTEHMFYSMHYPLNELASGQHLLDTLIRAIGDLGIELYRMPPELG